MSYKHKMTAEQHIDTLVTSFYNAFNNRNGLKVNFETFALFFVNDARISKKTNAGIETWSIQEFWQPRFELLSNGQLTGFYEWETQSRTSIFNDIAARESRYEKKGLLNGDDYQGDGHKLFQFVLTKQGWKIASILWQDL